MDATKPMAWVGVDVGKSFHWAVVVDAAGEILLSRRVDNEEADLSELVEEALAISGGELYWAVDQPGGAAALLLALLWGHGQRVLYIPGLAVDRARDGFRGEAKTDRRDALVIAEQARMRRDLKPLEPTDGLLCELRLLLSRRRDLVDDQSRALQRLRDTLLALFPGLERALPDMRYRGALELLKRYQTPRAVLRSGRRRIEAYLRGRGARNAASLAEAAVAAAKAQKAVATTAEGVAASIVADLAREVLALKEQIATLDAEVEARFRAHPMAGVLTSMPGMGALLGAEFLATVGDPRDGFASADQLAAFAGLAPAARDSGKRTGNDRRMRGGNRRLKQVFYQAAFASLRSSPESRAFYDRKRAEGKRHNQALIALARRRVNVLWAMLRDGTEFDPAFAA
jgi:transposase